LLSRPVVTASVFFLLWLVGTGRCWGWGVGHQDIVRATFSHLPADIQDEIPADARQVATEKYALYPDSFDLFKPEEVGPQAMEELKSYGLPNRYALHSDKGRAVAFVLLVEAFRQKQYDHAALWIAALSHSTADMAAINHDPLVHSVIYTSAYKLHLPGGLRFGMLGCFDISDIARDHDGGADAWEKSIEPALLSDDGRDGQTALLEIMAYGQQGADFCAPRGIPILADAVQAVTHSDAEARLRSRQKLSQLGAWAVGRTVRDTAVAARLAKTDEEVKLTPAIEAKFAQQNEAFMRQRNIADDALFDPILRPLADAGPAADAPKPTSRPNTVGVVLEPTWRMNDAMLGYGDRVIDACICRAMQDEGHSYVTLDVRDILDKGFPSPARVPTIVISATALRDYGWMHVADLNRQLHAYLQDGGHLLWIGGNTKPPEALSPLVDAMAQTAGQPIPGQELLHQDPAVHDTKLILLSGAADPSWTFYRPLLLKVGWSQPLDPWRFDKSSDVLQPFLQIQEGSNPPSVVGVYWNGAAGKQIQGAYLPIYSVAPHLLVESAVVADPSVPRLDEPSIQILDTVLNQLSS
jgi:hypothetical protein